MSKKNKIWWIIIAVLFVGGIAYLGYYFSNREGGSGMKVYDQWDITYDPEDKNPYGTYVISQLLDSLELGENFEQIEDERAISLDSNEIFLFIGEEMFLSNRNRDSLINAIAEGSSAFFIVEKLEQEFIDLLLYDQISGVDLDSTINASFTHPDLKGVSREIWYMDEKKLTNYPWRYIKEDNIYHESAKVLGYGNNKQINFIRFKLGKGYLFIHTSPIAFTNLNVLREEGFLYAEDVFSHLPPGKIEYHSYARFPRANNGEGTGGDGGGGSEPKKSPLEFILSQQALRWAFFTLVAVLLTTLLFRSRRRRKSIEVYEKKMNTTVGHIDTVANIFLQQKQHHKLIAIKEKNFYEFVKNHYYISPKNNPEDFTKKLSEKSGIELKRIEDIRQSLHSGKGFANQETLHAVHKKVEYFYRNCSVSNQTGFDQKRLTRTYVIKEKLLLPLIFLGAGVLLCFIGLLGLVASVGIGILAIAVGVFGVAYGLIHLNRPIGTLKDNVFTEHKTKISINLKELKKVELINNKLVLTDFEHSIQLNLNVFPDKDRAFFEAIAGKYHKTN